MEEYDPTIGMHASVCVCVCVCVYVCVCVCVRVTEHTYALQPYIYLHNMHAHMQ